MSDTQHEFVTKHYAPRAAAYVSSAVHSAGADLDQIEAAVRGCVDARVLDLGCGGGHVSYCVAPHVREVVACDLTPDMLAHVKRAASERGLGNIVVQQGAAERLPFADASFDILLCRYTAHHWRDIEAGLREARRVLKAGGRAVFADCVAPSNPLLDTHLQTIELPCTREGQTNHTVFGRVVGVHISDEIIRDGLVDMSRFHPIARLGYFDYTVVREVFTMRMPR